jgi:hypothetical protein
MAERKRDRRKLPRPNEPTQASKDKMQEALARKLPNETQNAEEWGERLATGKQIATGGTMDQLGKKPA